MCSTTSNASTTRSVDIRPSAISYQSDGVRKAGWISLGKCQPNRGQARERIARPSQSCQRFSAWGGMTPVPSVAILRLLHSQGAKRYDQLAKPVRSALHLRLRTPLLHMVRVLSKRGLDSRLAAPLCVGVFVSSCEGGPAAIVQEKQKPMCVRDEVVQLVVQDIRNREPVTQCCCPAALASGLRLILPWYRASQRL